MEDIKLKPCPFCGSEAEFVPMVLPFVIVGCKKIECGASIGLATSKQQAAEK